MTIITNPTTVSASIPFFVAPPDGERAWFRTNATPELGERPSNFGRVPHDVVIENLRGKEDTVTLDTAGFQFYANRPPKHTSFNNEEEIQREYYPESIDLIKELTGASRVVVFDHTIRRRRPGELDDGPQKRQPVANAHVDQTPKASVDRVHRHLPAEDVPELLKHRFQIINLWRPISHRAVDWPLALCDFRSVDAEKDVAPVALIYPDREGETYGVKYNPNHKWKFLYGMNTDELVLIKCFDSVRDGSVSLFTPHTAFPIETPPGTPPRESIELRALVFYDD